MSVNTDFDVVAVGDLNADLILAGDVTPVFGQVEKVIDDATLTMGGSTSIFACGAARLGLRVAFVGKVGSDPIGDFLLDTLVSRGIDIAGVRRDAHIKTGLTVILSRGVDRAMLTYLGTLGALGFQTTAIVERAEGLVNGGTLAATETTTGPSCTCNWRGTPCRRCGGRSPATRRRFAHPRPARSPPPRIVPAPARRPGDE